MDCQLQKHCCFNYDVITSICHLSSKMCSFEDVISCLPVSEGKCVEYLCSVVHQFHILSPHVIAGAHCI